MRDHASNPDSEERALLALLRAIASRDARAVSRLLEERPGFARMAIRTGATRENASPWYFREIPHYVYAGDTPLHLAAASYQRDLAEKLVSLGANVRSKNRRGAEPLHYASDGAPGSRSWNPAAQGALVEFLIRAGAEADAEDKSGVAPLHRAVRTRCTAAVRALLANGADPLRKNRSGSTPLHLAVQNTGRGGSGSPASRAEQTEIIRLLLRHGARPSDRDSRGRTVGDCVRAAWIRALLGPP